MAENTTEVKVNQAVLVGLNSPALDREETATERSMEELAALLETAGLGWRRWVSGGLVAAAAIAAAALALLLPRELHTLLPGAESLGRICSYLTVLVLAACLGLLSMLGRWRDRVREWEGQTVVAEYSGIFRETGYRYVNWFVHGEQVYVWED